MKHGLPRLACCFLAGLLSSATVFAGTATATFPVTANVNDTCGIAAAPLMFGVFDPTGGTTQNGTTTLTVLCTNSTPYEIGLDAGGGAGATINERMMTDLNNNILKYSLFQNASRTTVWGNTVGNNTWSGTGTGSQQSITVYGKILSGQTDAIVGTYLDTVTVSVNY